MSTVLGFRFAERRVPEADRDDARSLLTPQARRAVLTVQSNGFGEVEAAARRLVEEIARECGGSCRIVVADREAPIREF